MSYLYERGRWLGKKMPYRQAHRELLLPVAHWLLGTVSEGFFDLLSPSIWCGSLHAQLAMALKRALQVTPNLNGYMLRFKRLRKIENWSCSC